MLPHTGSSATPAPGGVTPSLAPETPGYAGWLTFVQQRDRTPGLFARGVGFWTAAIVVLVGTWLGFLFFVLMVRAVFG